MVYYVDISDEVFRAVQNHSCHKLTLDDGQLKGEKELKVEDELKLYHPSNKAEAIRVGIQGVNHDSDARQWEITITMLEYMFTMRTELDEQLEEEERILKELDAMW